MARAKRHFIPGYVWHVTHRCHNRDFLLKLVRDRDRWKHWLFEAKKRYDLHVLDYILTSNHIHLLVLDDGGRDVIPNSLKLVAGRVGQEYNIRKNRKGAFWEDRYHATAIQTGEHLIHNASSTLTQIWFALAWFHIPVNGLTADTMKSRSPRRDMALLIFRG